MPEAKHYHFDVKMTCEGCSNSIKRVLTRLEPEVSKFEVSLEKQTVDVFTHLPFETVLAKIKKTGKEVKNAQIV
ncbi:LAMI_0F02498g1_1 [Lachancea mirantina]|uniref:LAMI_0F02498g1_1 n=1 Tax=Lachancea mirantina TaxID=1230905 RepID=A0A1G4JWJ1_9SACH|nr:LAMI_0F02498g1_1 [Lachancea mirantina]